MEGGLLQLPSYNDHVAGDELDQAMSNCTCDMQPNVTLVFNFFPICNLPLAPAWLLAVVIGVVGGQTLLGLGPSVLGSFYYSLTFFMYAAMITAGFTTHSIFLVECGAGPVSKGFADAAYLDASLTCCIAISFLFDGLVDLKIIPERNTVTWSIMGLTYAGLFYANFAELVDTTTLYTTSIIIGCPSFLLCQVIALCRGSRTLCSLLYLSAAGIAGGVSFLLFTRYLCLLCTVLGAWSIEGVWYYGSDVAMFFLLLYALATREPSSTVTAKKTPLAFTTTPVTQPLKLGHTVQ